MPGELRRCLSEPKKRVFPPEARYLNPEGWKAATKTAPQWTMQPRGETFGINQSCKTELTGDAGSAKTAVLSTITSPKLSAGGRTPPLPADEVPAPGYYKVPSTLEKSHPTMRTSGRGWHWGSSERKKLAEVDTDQPAPDKYNVSIELSKARVARDWTMLGRNTTIPPGHFKDELWDAGPSLQERLEPRKIYDRRDLCSKGLKSSAPHWTMSEKSTFGSMFESSMKSTAKSEPGPGQYKVGHNGKVRRSPSWGFGSCPRWPKKDVEPRAY